jgi:hypothetical protein
VQKSLKADEAAVEFVRFHFCDGKQREQGKTGIDQLLVIETEPKLCAAHATVPGKRICLAFVEDKLDAPKALGPASSRPIFQPSGRRDRVANSADLVQCVHERFQWPRLDPAVQDNCEARVVP